MKVLLVDDEPDISEVITISFNLRWPDAQVLSAETGGKSIELARRESPDVVVLDIELPDMDGFEAIGRFPCRHSLIASVCLRRWSTC